MYIIHIYLLFSILNLCLKPALWYSKNLNINVFCKLLIHTFNEYKNSLTVFEKWLYRFKYNDTRLEIYNYTYFHW